MAARKTDKIQLPTTASAPVSTTPSKAIEPTAKASVDVAGLDELSFQFNMEGLKRQQRSHDLRGQTAKVEASRLDADKQELRVTRKQLELETEEQKVLKAQDNLKGQIADTQLNRLGIVKKLGQKAYNISGDVSYLQKAQTAIKSAPLQALSDIGD